MNDAPTTSHSERDILDACVELIHGMADDFLEYLDWIGAEPDEEENRFDVIGAIHQRERVKETGDWHC